MGQISRSVTRSVEMEDCDHLRTYNDTYLSFTLLYPAFCIYLFIYMAHLVPVHEDTYSLASRFPHGTCIRCNFPETPMDISSPFTHLQCWDEDVPKEFKSRH
ncbi:hypothetical protein BDN72DRAFT_93709 [Pluteus cervinus]|uniref:Uncharacterized protein n=1 Tax=Pluteus cervinus TaxID=181527 RepID=A0ACD3APF8_9AGAR|nr:hypothetical protein BDN72DRAFT_93709 [Pluteus cervinus]